MSSRFSRKVKSIVGSVMVAFALGGPLLLATACGHPTPHCDEIARFERPDTTTLGLSMFIRCNPQVQSLVVVARGMECDTWTMYSGQRVCGWSRQFKNLNLVYVSVIAGPSLLNGVGVGPVYASCNPGSFLGAHPFYTEIGVAINGGAPSWASSERDNVPLNCT